MSVVVAVDVGHRDTSNSVDSIDPDHRNYC
jgi:hypothetical protein